MNMIFTCSLEFCTDYGKCLVGWTTVLFTVALFGITAQS